MTTGRVDAAAATPGRRRRWAWRAAPALAGALAGAAVFAATRQAPPDDAFITLDYARNLAERGRWGLLADRPSNTATSPLNVWLLAAGTWVTGRPVVAVGLSLVVTLAATGWWTDGLRRALEVSRALPYLLLGLLACSPLLVSTVGLETYLGAAVLVGVARYAAGGRAVAAGVLVGVAVLVRPDLAVPAAVLAVGLLVRAGGARAGLGALLVAAATAAPWHVFAWLQLGGAVPDTLWLKLGEPWEVRGHRWTVLDGWRMYLGDFPAATVLALAPAALGVTAAGWLMLDRRRPARRAGLVFAAAGVAHFAVFALVGTAPYAWYLAPSAVCLTATAAIGASSLRWPALAAPGLVLAASLAFLATWPWTQGPISYNWGTAAQYARIGSDVGRITGRAPTRAVWEIGTTTFFCRCSLLDAFGDRALADRAIQRKLAGAGPLLRAVAAVNFAHRRPTRAPAFTWVLQPGRVPGAVAQFTVSSATRGEGPGSLVRSSVEP